jgi:hypothetical protein
MKVAAFGDIATKVSEQRITSIFRINTQPKRWFIHVLHGAISMKVAAFIQLVHKIRMVQFVLLLCFV